MEIFTTLSPSLPDGTSQCNAALQKKHLLHCPIESLRKTIFSGKPLAADQGMNDRKQRFYRSAFQPQRNLMARWEALAQAIKTHGMCSSNLRHDHAERSFTDHPVAVECPNQSFTAQMIRGVEKRELQLRGYYENA